MYLCSGTLSKRQNFLIKLLLMPSGPAAVRVRVSLTALSSSKIEISFSKLSANSLLIFMLLTNGDAKMSGPRNPSMEPRKSFLWVTGSLYKFS